MKTAISSVGHAQRRGTALMVMGGLVLGTIGVFVREANVDPMTTVMFRCLFGALALLFWGAATGRLHELRLSCRELRTAVCAGVLIMLNWVLFFAAIPRVSIAVATVLFHIQPFLVMAAGVVMYGERASKAQLAWAAIALTGLVLASGLLGDAEGPGVNLSYKLGVVFCLTGALMYAGVTLIARSATTISPYALTWWQCVVGTVLTAWWPISHGWPQKLATWLWLGGLGSIHTGLAYALLYTGMQRLRANQIALLQFVYPLVAILVDRMVYGHKLSDLQTLGVLLMAGALWIVRRGNVTTETLPIVELKGDHSSISSDR